ncbi:MAG: EamA family transporter RarD [Burkholderiales bacterium]|nr:EamA family transporter RarD [Burkholderiales bacterium]
MNPGIVYATLAYGIWGLFPLYFRQVAEVPALEVVMHRMVWSLLFVALLLLLLRRWAWVRVVVHQPLVLGAFAVSAVLLSGNWLTYVWAVHNAHVLDASLGYFILPLVNVGLGFVFLGERPRSGQWLAVGIASTGVLWLAVQAGHVPWLALVLAVTFGIYGLLRKIAVLGALEGLALETALLAPLAMVYLGWEAWTGRGVFVQGTTSTLTWLLAAGPLTAIPLLLFAAGARRIPMATLGILQYLSPTLLFLLSTLVLGEPMQATRLLGFVLIWVALMVYSLEGWQFRQRRRRHFAKN